MRLPLAVTVLSPACLAGAEDVKGSNKVPRFPAVALEAAVWPLLSILHPDWS